MNDNIKLRRFNDSPVLKSLDRLTLDATIDVFCEAYSSHLDWIKVRNATMWVYPVHVTDNNLMLPYVFVDANRFDIEVGLWKLNKNSPETAFENGDSVFCNCINDNNNSKTPLIDCINYLEYTINFYALHNLIKFDSSKKLLEIYTEELELLTNGNA